MDNVYLNCLHCCSLSYRLCPNVKKTTKISGSMYPYIPVLYMYTFVYGQAGQ